MVTKEYQYWVILYNIHSGFLYRVFADGHCIIFVAQQNDVLCDKQLHLMASPGEVIMYRRLSIV